MKYKVKRVKWVNIYLREYNIENLLNSDFLKMKFWVKQWFDWTPQTPFGSAPDQTPPCGIWSGSALLAFACLSEYLA